MLKKITSLFLVLIFVFGSMISVNADGNIADENVQSIDENINTDPLSIGTFALYTKSTITKLTISSGTATAKAIFSGYNGTTTKITITMYLQKKGFLGLYWSDVASWTATYNSYNAELLRTYGGLSSDTYRVKAVYTAYSGTKSETITEYSNTVKI